MINTRRNKVCRLLIANRGEIACRIIRTARRMGITTVAVYSDADAQAQHTQMADESYHLGGAPLSESYLNSDRLLAIAEQANVDSIHPGYGFFSENAAFAQACQQRGIRFVGPPVAAIASMGSKSQAKAIMAKAGVPLIPGYHGDDQTDQTLIQEALAIGFPVLIKAASGGGGKGMRVVTAEGELLENIQAARREAQSTFGDPTLLLEAYLSETRHIEVQLFFDSHGQGIYLFDRDCSLQRRYQKVIEEAPAPNVSDTVRQSMGEAAVAAGKALHYEGAGTVEFLLAGNDFYFMEVNTRLQVEHPVTEYITGLDLVAWQLRIAAGEKLPLQQHELVCQGHAIEARFYAEDPAQGFMPSAGRLNHLSWPQASETVRVDTGVVQGDTVSSWYDPMLAKVIAKGDTREQAIDHLVGALSETFQAGLADNRNYLLSLLNQPAFRQAQLCTTFIEDHVQEITLTCDQQELLLSLAGLYQYYTTKHECTSHALYNLRKTPFYFTVEGNAFTVTVTPVDNRLDAFSVSCGEREEVITVKWQPETEGLSGQLFVADRPYKGRVIPQPGQQLHVFVSGYSLVIGLPGCRLSASADTEKTITAPMNGLITHVNVAAGETVTQGALLLTLEAMKMEYSIKAPHEGIIEQLCCAAGDQVNAGALLLAFGEES
ncbi:acetyl/propionyl/methylcrotonyl-CoA carboxylase subunit alpha [Candidatus Sororendozoicomonas aggregata]|uniref:acetyl/propionyl/methylcrotonyl-CoA carboxylase subunit alpha n=1 Tax=Candidatus Sororendozoicomonas aggregata TaxID=3073239 RepID=UPI002ECFEE31